MKKTMVFAGFVALAISACVATTTNTGWIDIPFEKSFSASDLVVTKLEASVEPTLVVFTLYYKSGKDRYLSFFDPPDGTVLKYFDPNGLKKDSDSVTFRIDREKLVTAIGISMRFSTNQNPEADRNGLFPDLSVLRGKIPGIAQAIITKNAASDAAYATNLTAAGALGIARRLPPANFRRGRLTALPVYNADSGAMWQVDLRGWDVSSIDITQRKDDLLHADYDSKTIWPKALPDGFDPVKIMDLGRNPGLEVRALHAAGVTGKGVGIAIIDQGLLVDHVEYKDRIRLYEEIHSGDRSAAMHGPAVASIAVGKTVGVAPEADLYYIAETHGVFDGKGGFAWDLSWLAKSIDRIVEINEGLPKENKIRVISISLGISERLGNGALALEAIRRAREKGIYTAFVGSDPYFGMGRGPYADPDSPTSYLPGAFLAKSFYSGNSLSGIGIPMDARCTASPTGIEDYVFYSEGGMSWTVPYVAGLFALACQVKPDVTPELFWKAAAETGDYSDSAKDGKSYRLQKIVSPAKLIQYLRTGG
jgi:hypothetical protein